MLAAPESKSVEAYELYLQGAQLLDEGTRESTEVAFHYFSRAAGLDETLVGAHLGLGAVHNVRYFSGWGSGPSSLSRAAASYERALALDPESMVARRGLVMTHFFQGESEAVLEQGRMAARIGRADDAETLLTRALTYDHSCFAPLSLKLYRRAIAIDPGDGTVLEEAERAYEAAGYSGWEVEILVMARVRLGDPDGAIELLRENVRRGRVFYIWEPVLKSVSLTLPRSEAYQDFHSEHEALKARYQDRFGMDESESWVQSP